MHLEADTRDKMASYIFRGDVNTVGPIWLRRCESQLADRRLRVRNPQPFCDPRILRRLVALNDSIRPDMSLSR